MGSHHSAAGLASHPMGVANGPTIQTVIKCCLFFVLFSARTNEEIVAIIVKGDSKAFDVDVLKAFIKILPDNTEVSYKYQDVNSFYNSTACSSR